MRRPHLRKNRFSLRLRLMVLVTAELLVCIFVSLGSYALLKDIIPLAPSVLFLLMLLGISLTVGLLITNFLSKLIFAPHPPHDPSHGKGGRRRLHGADAGAILLPGNSGSVHRL